MRNMNQNGFSVVEVIIAAGILGIVSLGIATLMTNSMQSQRQISMRVDKTAVESDLKYLFKEAQRSCTCLFQNELKAESGGGSLAGLISQSRREIPIRTDNLNLSFYGSSGTCSSAEKSPIITSGKVVGSHDLEVKSMKLAAPVDAGGGKYFVTLTTSIQSTRNTDTSMKPVVVASIPIRIVAGAIECDHASEVLANVTCSGNQVLAGFNGMGEPICQSIDDAISRKLASVSCPSGQVLSGFSSSGSPHCVSVTSAPPAYTPPPAATPVPLQLVSKIPYMQCSTGGTFGWIVSTYLTKNRCADSPGMNYWISEYNRYLDKGKTEAQARSETLAILREALKGATQSFMDQMCLDSNRYTFVSRDECRVRCAASPNTAGCISR